MNVDVNVTGGSLFLMIGTLHLYPGHSFLNAFPTTGPILASSS
jgi:hypothetical protein